MTHFNGRVKGVNASLFVGGGYEVIRNKMSRPNLVLVAIVCFNVPTASQSCDLVRTIEACREPVPALYVPKWAKNDMIARFARYTIFERGVLTFSVSDVRTSTAYDPNSRQCSSYSARLSEYYEKSGQQT